MSETPTTESSGTPPQSRESVAESFFSQGKDETPRRRTVQFEDNSSSQKGASVPVPARRSSLLKKDEGSEQAPGDDIDKAPSNSAVLEPVKEDAGPSKTAEVAPPLPGEIPLGGEEKVAAPVVISEAIQSGAQVQDTKAPDESTHSSSEVEPADGALQQQESEETADAQSTTGQEIPGSDSEEEKTKSDEPPPPSCRRYGEAGNWDSDNEGGAEKAKVSKRGSVTRRNSMRRSAVLKEIIGSIEKKKGPNLPDKLGFGSSEERKALMVESLKDRRKSSMTTLPKEHEETPKPLDRRKTGIQGLGFGSTERRKTLFDKEDPLKPKEKRRSSSRKEDDNKESTGAAGKGRRASGMKDPVSGAASSLKQSAIIALIPPDTNDGKVEQVMNQPPLEMQREQAQGGKDSRKTEANQQSKEEKQELGRIPSGGKTELSLTLPYAGDISLDAPATGAELMEGVAEVRYPSEEPVGEDDFSEAQKDLTPGGEGAVSIYTSEFAGSNHYGLRSPSIDAIPLDDNEGLASTLLAGKVDEPLRNELENWLSSAITRVENNLSSSWSDPVLRQHSTLDKDSPRRSIPPTRTPRNTMVAPPDSSSSSSKGLSRRPSLTSLRGMRRLSALSLGILAGNLSDENELLRTEQLTGSDSTLSPKLGLLNSAGKKISPGLAPTDVTPQAGKKEESHWNQETAEEGLRRLQREVERRAWAQNVARKAPRLMLPDSLRKRKKAGEPADYLHAESSQKRVRDNILNKDLLCYYGGTKDPEKLKNAGLSELDIIGVDQTDLELFKNLQYLDLSVNQVNMNDLWALSALRKLSLMSNQMCYLNSVQGQFNHLQALDLSYNILGGSAIVHLANLPALETLNLDHNSIAEIPEASGEPWSFNRLRIFSAAHNFLKASSLLPLSKITRLERLLLAYNAILGVPEEIKEAAEAFPRLQMLDLTNNKVANSEKLTPLLRCRTLKQVLLWETPLARKLACDGANRLLDSARPTLLHILRAEQAGQSWITEQSQPQSVELEEKMHIISQNKRPEIKLFDRMAEQEMANVFKYTSEMISKEAGDKHCALHKGYSSAILPFTEGLQSPIMSISETKPSERVHSSVATSDLPPSLDEAMESIHVSNNLTENHLTDGNAAIVCLQNTLGVPFREVNFHPRHYLTMTKSGMIRVNECRLANQTPISPRKDAVYLAQRFLYQAQKLSGISGEVV